jgi:hypothetical protein
MGGGICSRSFPQVAEQSVQRVECWNILIVKEIFRFSGKPQALLLLVFKKL